jgi:hypothetical protein
MGKDLEGRGYSIVEVLYLYFSRRTGVPEEVRTEHLRNGSLERYRYVRMLSVRVKAEDAKQEEDEWKSM